MKTFIRRNNWLEKMPSSLSDFGWGNGYVIIPKGHKLYGKDYDDINVSVHGGLTFSEYAKNLDWKEIDKNDEGWVVGFDTVHYQDNISNCSKNMVKEETENLKLKLRTL